jgi:hypothetical protein
VWTLHRTFCQEFSSRFSARSRSGKVPALAHQSGGTVIVKSKVGSGTSVTLYLRRARRAPLTKPAEPPALQPVITKQGTVLVVEDSAEVAEVTASLVEQLGYWTVRARRTPRMRSINCNVAEMSISSSATSQCRAA